MCYRWVFTLLAFGVLLPNCSLSQSKPLPSASPADVGMDAKRLAHIDRVVEESIRKKQLPGAVVLVMRKGKIALRKAYGSRRLQPSKSKMTVTTVFDLASLTKPIVTAMGILLLLERGQLRLSDPLSRHLPAFTGNKRRKITIRHLLLHTSGLIPDNSIKDYRNGPDKAWQKIFGLEPIAEPGAKFMYSDMGYILLGKVVEKISGESLDEFAKKNVFEPLGMNDTTYKPGPQLAKRCAPTEKRDGKWLQGVVHDPRARALGGVAGHAGLFSTADDLAVLCQLFLNRGEFGGKRILSRAAVRLMTKPHKVPRGLRGLGWDIDTGYSSNRGELFPVGGYGHTGFTGTSIWIDPGSETVVIFMSNRVHPNGKGSVIRLRSRVATLVAASITER